ncbi:protein zntC isoform X2 [Phymastichus coffea]|uniref:protein zntC isoform X2 n=1 Tax=Phymastichus coffea TaxID=108790 RepID=UPI00273B7BF1|nr:protein zntC isoform X2 [Phymastichus coffea]
MEVPSVTTQPTSIGPSPQIVLLLAKVGSMFVLGFGSLLLGMMPLIIGRCRMKKSETRRAITSVSSASTTLTSASALSVSGVAAVAADTSQGLLTSLLLCFGGGVLLFTTFLHLAPEVRESVELHQSNGQLATLGSLSLAELLFCCGFFVVYLVEETVHAALTGKPESSEALLYRTVSVRRCNNSGGSHANSSSNNTSSEASSAQRNSLTVQPRAWRTDASDAEEDANMNQELPTSKSASGPMFLLSSGQTIDDAPRRAIDLEQQAKAALTQETNRRHHHHHHHHQHHHHHHHHHSHSMRSLLTVLALSFHAIFEGLAVGLEPAFSSVVYLAAAIATHKLVISFCVGMELYVAGASNRTILGYLSVFSMVTPLGIGIGLALGHFRNDSDTMGPTPTILQGMAAGTLLYVVFFEVLARERANDKSGLLQLAAILVGFTLMLGLQLATAHSHEHGGHSHGDHYHGEEQGEIHNHASETLVGDKHNYVLGAAAIERVTDKVVDVLSTTLT